MFIAELGFSKFRCKSTSNYTHAQKNNVAKYATDVSLQQMDHILQQN